MTFESFKQTLPIFSDVETVIFCDESKFSVNDKDVEDAVFYFSVVVPTRLVPVVTREFNAIIADSQIQTPTFHAKNIFRNHHPRKELMKILCDLLKKHRLFCLCFKYQKALLYEASKQFFSKYNDDDLINFNNHEFQALTYFGSALDAELRTRRAHLVKGKLILFLRLMSMVER